MPTSAVLEDLIDALEDQSDSLFPYLDRGTGKVQLITGESISLADAEPEEIDLLSDWQKEEAELAVRIETSDQYLRLPDRFEINEWNIMNEFCHEMKREDIRATLLQAVQGSHAFRRFKDQIANYNLWDEWNRFRRQKFEKILREWCEENGIILTSKCSRPRRDL
jgi:hypothetical protein